MSWDHYLGIYRFLNDPRGLGLEVGTSIFFFVTNALCHSSFGYFDEEGAPSTCAPAIREMADAGYIDAVHAYGDFDDGGFTRLHAEMVLEECERWGMRFPLWTNHGSERNFQNLGHERLAAHQHGDDPESAYYHLDLLRQIGAEFFWVDDGYQEQVADGTPLLYDERARDGSKLDLVRRYRGLRGQPAPMAASLPDQMTIADLDLLVERESACIYYQHLGAWAKTGPTTYDANRPPYFDERGLATLSHLAQLYHDGKCLVATPARLLRYLHVRDSVTLGVGRDREVVIEGSVKDPRALEGLTFTCHAPPTRVVLVDRGGHERTVETQTVPSAASGEVVVTVPWRKLNEFSW
jgi:hypothetical protein